LFDVSKKNVSANFDFLAWSCALDQLRTGCGLPAAEQVRLMVVPFLTTTWPFLGCVSMRGGTERTFKYRN